MVLYCYADISWNAECALPGSYSYFFLTIMRMILSWSVLSKNEASRPVKTRLACCLCVFVISVGHRDQWHFLVKNEESKQMIRFLEQMFPCLTGTHMTLVLIGKDLV